MLGFVFKNRKTISDVELDEMVENLLELPSLLSELLSLENSLNTIAQELKTVRDVLYVGRGISFPIALDAKRN